MQSMTAPLKVNVAKRRATLRAMGLRPPQIWIPDARRPGFAEECSRQARLVAAADACDTDLSNFPDAAPSDAHELDG